MAIWRVPPQPYQAPRIYLLIPSTYAATVTADILICKGVTKTVAADILLKKLGVPATITADSLIRQTFPKTVSADVLFSVINTPSTITADTLILKYDVPKTVAVSAYFGETVPIEITASVLIRDTFSETLTADAMLRVSFLETITADTLIQGPVTEAVTADVLILDTKPKTIPVDTLLQKLGVLKTVTVDSLIQQNNLVVTVVADAGLKGNHVNVLADTRIAIWLHNEVSITARAYILPSFVGDTVNFFFEYFVELTMSVTFKKLNIDTTLTVDVEFDPPFWDALLPVDVALQLINIPSVFPADVLFQRLDIDASLPVDVYLYEAEPSNDDLTGGQEDFSHGSGSCIPVVIATFTKVGSTTYTHTWGTNIIGIIEHIDPYKHTSEIVLHNATKALTAINLVGYTCVISWGMLIDDVPQTIDSAPTIVVNQKYTSKEGVLTVTVECNGFITMMGYDRASVKESSSTAAERIVEDGSELDYVHDPTDNEAGWTIRQWIDAICTGTSTAFSHCTHYGTVWHGAGSGAVPGMHFEVSVGDRRSDVLRYLLVRSGIVMRPERDGFLHFYAMNAGTAYTYELLGNHTFYNKNDMKTAVIPNMVVVYGDIDEHYTVDPHSPVEHRFQGQSGNGASIALIGEYCYYETMQGLTSDGACSTMAAGIQNAVNATALLLESTIPMDCFPRIYDYATFIDSREGSTKAGNIGIIERYFNENGYKLKLSIGGFGGSDIGSFLNSSSDSISKVVKTPDTLSASLPDTDLLGEDEFIWFANIKAPVQSLLYLHSYNVYAGEGSVDLYIQIGEHEDFLTCYGFPAASPAGRKYEKPMWLTAAGSTYVAAGRYVRFGVINTSHTVEARYVNASVNYDLRAMKDALY
jgi:hypothetical protein